MRLGLQWDEWNPSYNDPNNALIQFYSRNHDYSQGLLDLPMETDPGIKYAYNTVASVSLGQAIQNRSSLTFVDFLNTYQESQGQFALLPPPNRADQAR